METSVSEYYSDLTDDLELYAGDLLACHLGLWGPDTKNEWEGLLRANRTLVHGCSLGPGQHVLDAGCGIGGTAITLAETCGVRVTGLTNCEPHVAVATRHAAQREVRHLVEFRYGDFMDLPFSDASFDAVLNHESFCYAEDKLAYLRGVYRVLKPGGRWQALDGLLSGAPMTEEHQANHSTAQRGWRMPPFETWRDVVASLEEAGFVDIQERDLSSEVVRSTKRVSDRWLLQLMINPRANGFNRALQEFMEAAVNFDRGLREGAYTYRFLSGARPA